MADKKVYNLTFVSSDGERFPVSFEVVNGKDAFEVWRDIPGNEQRTLEEYQKYIRGDLSDIPVAVTVTESRSFEEMGS